MNNSSKNGSKDGDRFKKSLLFYAFIGLIIAPVIWSKDIPGFNCSIFKYIIVYSDLF